MPPYFFAWIAKRLRKIAALKKTIKEDLKTYGRVFAPVLVAGIFTAGGFGEGPSRPAILPLRVRAMRLSLLEPWSTETLIAR